MSWLILAIAVFTEICWALSLKWAATLATWQASAVPIVLSFVNMGLLALAMRGLPAGTAYAVWTGCGAVGVIIGGVLLFGDKVSLVQACFMAVTVVGIVGTKLFAQAGGAMAPPTPSPRTKSGVTWGVSHGTHVARATARGEV